MRCGRGGADVELHGGWGADGVNDGALRWRVKESARELLTKDVKGSKILS